MHDLLAPHITPQQATLLRYGGALPDSILAELCARLRAELAGIEALVAPPVAAGRTDLLEGAYWPGTTLCADLTGFTALAEALAAGGLQGVEELSALINRVFATLLEEIDRYGGEVLKFGGDALTAFFPAERVGAAHGPLASAAGLAMQERMAEFAALSTSCGPWSLRLRVGVHSGPIFVAALGDERQRELLISGRTINRVALAQERAAPGEVLISTETLAMLDGAATVARPAGLALLQQLPPPARVVRCPLPLDEPSNSIETAATLAARIAALKPFTPAALPQRFLTAGAGGEFRPVSVVFVNFFSFSGLLALLEGQEHLAVAALNGYYRRVQQAVDQGGGSINKVDIASMGDKLLALFGAPLAQEDDPLRAVRAALALEPALREANAEARTALEPLGSLRAVDPSLRQRVGVANGTVFAGIVGAAGRREYTVIGQTANLAARLMGAAGQGEVLLGPATWAAVTPHVAVRHLAPLTLKGVAGSVHAAVALHEEVPSGSSAAGPLVGRSAELATLRALAQQARAGAGQVVALSGEAGIGKSRLAHALLAEICADDQRCAALTCRTDTQAAPYGAARALLTLLLGLPTGYSVDATRAALDEAVATLANDLAPFTPLLYGLFGVGRSSDALTGGDNDERAGQPERRKRNPLALLPPAEQRQRLHELIDALVGALCERTPLALLIDDAQHADASSLEMFGRLAHLSQRRPLLLLLAYRPEPGFAEPWLALPHATPLPLDGFDRAASAALLDALLGGPAPPALLPLLDRAEGSPFFLEALVQHLRDSGALRQNADGGWHLLRPLDGVSVPPTIERVQVARLDRLDEPTRELVQVAAVIGTRVPYAVLAGVYSQARRLAQQLTYLVATGVLAIDEHDPQQPFRFSPTLLRDVAYNSILYAQRRELHGRVARRIEQLYPEQLDMHSVELAHHYLLAEAWKEAFAYSLRAGRYARARYATAEALVGYRQANNLAAAHAGSIGPAERATALEELADTEVLAGLYDAAHQHLRVLQTLRADAPVALAAVRRKIGSVYEHQGQLDAALSWLRRAHELLVAHADALLDRARVLSDIGWVHFRRNELDEARNWLQQAATLLEDPTPEAAWAEIEAERAAVQNRLGGAAWMSGDTTQAQRYVERALASFEALGDLIGQGLTLNNLGILAEQRGDWPQAVASYKGALRANSQVGRRREAAMNQLNLGTAALHRGDVAAALPALEQAAQQLAAVADTLHEVMALRWLARAFIQVRRFAAAHETLERALALARRHNLPLDRLDVCTARGELALAQENSAAAHDALAAGRQLLPEVEHLSLEVGLFLRLAARLALFDGEHAQANSLLGEARATFAELGLAHEVATTDALQRTIEG